LENRLVPAVFNPLPTTPDGALGSLRADIIAANGNGQDNTINLQAGHYLLTLANSFGQENAAASGDLDLTSVGHTITIQGAGSDVTVVDAGGIDRVFQVIGNVTVVFSNLTITGGRAVDDGMAGTMPFNSVSLGGGILNSGGNVTLDHVLVEGNLAVGGVTMSGAGTNALGGGIWSNAALTVNNSTIENNEAIGGGGGAGGAPLGLGGSGGIGQGGAIFVSGGTVSLTATTIDSNQALGGNGGHGQNGNSGRPLGGNGGGGGAGEGGGLLLAGGQLTVASSTVSTNFAGGGAGGNGGLGVTTGNGGNGGDGGAAEGGGILATGGTLLLSNATVAVNSTAGGGGGTGGNSLAMAGNGGNAGTSQGGGMFVDLMGTANVHNSTVAFNKALLSHGGAAGTMGSSAGTAGTDSPGDGGGVFVVAGGTLNAISSIFGDNTAEGGTHPDFTGNFGTASHILLADNTGSNLAAGNPDGNGNLIGTSASPINPKLRTLDNYGGPTRTIALLSDSPAIDKGLNPDGLTVDQRGFASRTVNGTADIGAFEFGATVIVPTQPPPTSPPTTTPAPVFHALTARLVRVKHRTRLDIFDAATGALRLRVFPFGASRGKEHLLMGDVNDDGVADIIVLCVQANRLRTRVFSGTDLSDLTSSL
jgi:hypothetical protein